MSANFGNDPEFHDPIPKPGAGRKLRIAEILLVLGILVVLIGLLLPAHRSARPAAWRSQCTHNMKLIGLALSNYEQVYGFLPPAYTVDTEGRPLHSWRTLILPYLEYESLYLSIDLSKPWNDPTNAQALETSLPVFHCPDGVGRQNTTTYLAISAPNGCFHSNKPRRLAEITDGRASTVMVIEAGEENAVPWMAPVDADEALVIGLGPSSKLHHAGGVNACFVDGSVRFLKAQMPAKARRAIISISGNDDDAGDRF